MSDAPARPSRSFGRSLYWRIGLGLILFLAITLGLQVGLFLWVAGETEGGMPARMGRDFAELVASELESALTSDPSLDLEAYARRRLSELHRPAVVILADGRVVAPPGVDVPQGLTDAATALPVQVYLWADAPERGFVERTSGAIIVLLLFLIVMNATAVILRNKFEKRW